MASHLHWRLLITSIESPGYGAVLLTNIEFRAVAGGADQTVGGIATASTASSEAADAFDGDAFNTGWFSDAEPTVVSPQWIAYEFIAPVTIAEVSIAIALDPLFGPKNIALEYSDDDLFWVEAAAFQANPWIVDEAQLFSISIGSVAVIKQLTQPFGDFRLITQLTQPFKIQIATQLDQPFADAMLPFITQLNQPFTIRIATQFVQPWASPLTTALLQPYGATVISQLTQPWADLVPIAVQLNQPFSDSIPFISQLNQPYNLMPLNPIITQFNQPWSMADPATILLSNPASLTRNGIYIDMARYQVTMTEGGWNWTARIDLADPADYAALAKDDLLTLTIGGDVWQLIIDGKSLVRAQTEQRPIRQMVIECVGSAAQYEAPRAALITQNWNQAIDAQTAAEEIVGAAIDWQITSWTIPPGRLGSTDADPITLARSIINAVGGTLQANPDGTLLARPLFPVTVPDWASANPDQLYTDLGDILEVRDFGGTSELMDSVVVADQPAALALLSIEIDTREAGLNAGRFEFSPGESVGVLGFHPRSVIIGDVTTSAGTISSAADQLVDLDEDLLFADNNSAELLRPAEAIISAVWLGTELGNVLLEADQKTITTTTPGVSMLRIKYQALAQAWQVNTPLSAGGETDFPVALVAEFES